MKLRTTVFLATLLAAAPTLAEDRASTSAPKDSAKAKTKTGVATSEKLVFTNDDLERRYGPSRELPPPVAEETPAVISPAATSGIEGAGAAVPDAAATGTDAAAAAGETAPPEPDALQQLSDGQAREAKHRTEVMAAQSKVDQAHERIAELEKRVLALRNPLLARPAPPEKEREEWDRADNEKRVERSIADLEGARNDLTAAEQELARVRNTP